MSGPGLLPDLAGLLAWAAQPALGAALLAGGAVLLWSATPGARAMSAPGAGSVSRRGGARRAWLLVPLGVIALTMVGVLALIGGAVLWGSHALWRQHARRRAAGRVAQAVLEVSDLLAAELRAGRPAGEALAGAAAQWPPLAPAAEAFALGADVPQALRRVALVPGAGDLTALAAAWQLAHASGRGLAETVGAISAQLRADRATRRVVESELASARTTARLVSLLPLAALAMGGGVGGDPWRFLLDTPAGLVCLAVGAALLLGGLWWIEALAAAVLRS